MKNGKKLLSLILSVLMIMSCMVFAPVASAADSMTVTVKVTTTDSMSIQGPGSPSIYLVVTESNGTVHKTENLINTLCSHGGLTQVSISIVKGRYVEYSWTITSKVSKIAYITDFKADALGSTGNVKFKTEAWITPGGNSIISGGSVEKEYKSNVNFKGGKELALVNSNELVNNYYPTYVIRFIDLDGNVIKSENVSFGDSATAPSLPSKASDDTYHYTVAWDQGSAAWTGVRESADITAIATSVEHSYGDWDVTTKATCTVAGSKTRTCADCGYVQTSKINATGHAYGDWVVTTQPTCTTAGEKTKTCSKCENAITERISALGHTMVGVDKKDPTCTEPGYTKHTKCIRCDYTEDYTVIPATGHTFGKWYTVTESTCTVAGTKRRDCEKCDYFETEAMELASHTPKTVPAVPATCTETGLTEGSVCAVCGATLVAQKTVDSATT